MEIKKIGENKIRCAISEEEIQQMGFDIDDIIGNTETTQRFMRVVLSLVEEQEHISLEEISPMVKAELLQDHSMTITFGGDSDMNFKNLVDTVNHLMNYLEPEKLEEFKQMGKEEKQNAIDEFLKGYGSPNHLEQQNHETVDAFDEGLLSNIASTNSDTTKDNIANDKESGGLSASSQSTDDQPLNHKAADNQNTTDKQSTNNQTKTAEENKKNSKIFTESMPLGLEFTSLDDAIAMCKALMQLMPMPPSSLYKMMDKFYITMNFKNYAKDRLRPLAFAAVEYDNIHFSEVGQIAFIEEHGNCIVENRAIETLMQL